MVYCLLEIMKLSSTIIKSQRIMSNSGPRIAGENWNFVCVLSLSVTTASS